MVPMPLQRLRILVASPGDVERERDHVSAVAEELNRGVAAQAGFYVEAVRWETHVRPDMGRPEQIILDQIGAFDIFVGIMWQRFGTPTGIADSGTEEEFEFAMTSWQNTGRPRLLWYFSRAPIDPPASVEAAEQLLKVAQFRKRVSAMGLTGTYSSDADFKEKFREHLQQIVARELSGRTPSLEGKLLALLEAERARCRERNIAFLTPNLLLCLLSNPASLPRRIFDLACPGKAPAIVKKLRNYVPADPGFDSFVDFDWYGRRDVQAARSIALQEGKSVLDGRHLLLGFLQTEGVTQKELLRALGRKAFDGLVQTAESFGQGPAETPAMRGMFRG
jgi:hypothetical protein